MAAHVLMKEVVRSVLHYSGTLSIHPLHNATSWWRSIILMGCKWL